MHPASRAFSNGTYGSARRVVEMPSDSENYFGPEVGESS